MQENENQNPFLFLRNQESGLNEWIAVLHFVLLKDLFEAKKKIFKWWKGGESGVSESSLEHYFKQGSRLLQKF